MNFYEDLEEGSRREIGAYTFTAGAGMHATHTAFPLRSWLLY